MKPFKFSRHPVRSSLTGALLMLSACGHSSGVPQQGEAAQSKAAVLTVFIDVSGSAALIKQPDFANRMIERVGEEISNLELGDKIRILTLGDRSADHSFSQLEIETGIGTRLPAARASVELKIRQIIGQSIRTGGDRSTNILSAMEGAQPECTPRSTVMVVGDGIEDSDTYSVTKALRSDQPIDLPTAAHPYLRGCRIAMLGIGIAAEPGNGIGSKPLGSHQLATLTEGWSRYLQSAGASATDLRFTSII